MFCIRRHTKIYLPHRMEYFLRDLLAPSQKVTEKVNGQEGRRSCSFKLYHALKEKTGFNYQGTVYNFCSYFTRNHRQKRIGSIKFLPEILCIRHKINYSNLEMKKLNSRNRAVYSGGTPCYVL